MKMSWELLVPRIDVSLAKVILKLTSVDVSIAPGIFMFKGGRSIMKMTWTIIGPPH